MEAIKLTRSGKRPLAFNGTELFSQSTKGINSTRWTKGAVYETESGKIIVGIVYVTCWQGETDSFSAHVFNTREEAISHIEENAAQLAEDAASALNVSEAV